MSMGYVRRYYGVPARRGGRVEWVTSRGVLAGTITRATAYVYVRFDGEKRSRPLHPMEKGLAYLAPAPRGGTDAAAHQS